MATANGNEYLPQLQAEKDSIDDSFVHAAHLLDGEIEKVQAGGTKETKLVELHHDKPQKFSQKVAIPSKEFPKVNFVGRLLGPGGNSLKRLQDETGTKMAVLGRGSMKDKKKEDDLRKEGGKYAHLNLDLHLVVEAFAPPADAFGRLAHAMNMIKKYLAPEYSDEIRQQQFEEMAFLNGEDGTVVQQAPRGRGRGGGGMGGGMPAPRGRGGAAPLLSAPPMRGAPAGRGSRGTPRGRGGMRGAPSRGVGLSGGRGRGGGLGNRPEPLMERPSYEEDYRYGATNYEENYSYGGTEGGFGDAYDTAASDTQYFDYGHGTGGARDQGGYDDYEDAWSQGPGKLQPPKPVYRAHPYAGGRGRF